MKTRVLWRSVTAIGLFVVAACTARVWSQQARPYSEELEQIFRADQTDRQPPPGGRRRTEAEWQAVGVRDFARIARIKQIYRADGLRVPRDFYLAGAILQHSFDSTTAADDHLLAHELAIIAFAGGAPGAGYLVAASEDRFLTDDLGRKQRFGTQSGGRAFEVSDGVRDSLRARFGVPPLAELRTRGRPPGSPP